MGGMGELDMIYDMKNTQRAYPFLKQGIQVCYEPTRQDVRIILEIRLRNPLHLLLHNGKLGRHAINLYN